MPLRLNPDLYKLAGVGLGYAGLFLAFIFFHTNAFFLLTEMSGINLNLAKYVPVFILYLLSIPVVYRLSRQGKKAWLCCSGYIAATIVVGHQAIVIYLAASVLYGITCLQVKPVVKALLAVFFYGAFIGCGLTYFESRHWPVFSIYLFATLFSLRYILFFYNGVRDSFRRESLLDFLNYIFFLPYFIIVPFIVVMPKYDEFQNSCVDRSAYLSTASKGILSFSHGLVLVAAATIPKTVMLLLNDRFGSQFADKWLILLTYFYIATLISAYGYMIIGLMNGLGYDIKPPFERLAVSRNVTEFINKQLFYLKGFVVTIFYFPLQTLTKSLNIYASLFISTGLAVFCAGITYSVLALGGAFCSVFDIDSIPFIYGDYEQLASVNAMPHLFFRRFVVLFIFAVFLGLSQMIGYYRTREQRKKGRLASEPIAVKGWQFLMMLLAVNFLFASHRYSVTGLMELLLFK